MRSSAQGEFEGKALPLIGAVPKDTADYRSGGDWTEAMSEAKLAQSAEWGQQPPTESNAKRCDAQGIGGVRSSHGALAPGPERSGAPDSPVGHSV
jgi:hypothetical protein